MQAKCRSIAGIVEGFAPAFCAIIPRRSRSRGRYRFRSPHDRRNESRARPRAGQEGDPADPGPRFSIQEGDHTVNTTHHDHADCAGVAPHRPRPASREPGMEYWRVERVARYLDISRKRVYQLVQEKRLTAVRLGPRMTRIPRRSIDEYLESLVEADAGRD
jgi:excisionase family DNA binding protein